MTDAVAVIPALITAETDAVAVFRWAIAADSEAVEVFDTRIAAATLALAERGAWIAAAMFAVAVFGVDPAETGKYCGIGSNTCHGFSLNALCSDADNTRLKTRDTNTRPVSGDSHPDALPPL